MKNVFTSLFTLFLIVSSLSVSGQGDPVVVDATTGTLGADFNVSSDGDIPYVTSATDFASTSAPGNLNKVITYSITFPAAGVYDFYVKLRVGPGAHNDDSFYFGNGFGEKTPAVSSEWVIANNFSGNGHSFVNEYIAGPGSAATGIWKWINVSELFGEPVTFTVEEGSLTQTFQIGGRENGLDISLIAFGPSDYFYTPSNLENGEPGVTELPDPNATPPIADGLEKWLGNVHSPAQLAGFTNFWNQVTPENSGKWGFVEPERDQMSWDALDAAYNLAKDNDLPFRFHVLLWGNQQPRWIRNLPAAEQLEEIEEWFAAVSARYPDIDYLEVVNEPINDPPVMQNETDEQSGNYKEALGGDGDTGWDWIITAFEMARQYFPNAQLMINEYNILSSPARTQQYVGIIELLKERELIDAIGVQGHAFSTRGPASGMITVLDMLAETGLPIYVTEFDVDGPSDLVQLQDYRRIFPALWEHPSVRGITLWGYRPGLWRNEQGAYIINADGTERPAMVWLREYVQGTFVSVDAVNITSNNNATRISTKGGTLQLSAQVLPAGATFSNVVWTVSNDNIATVSPSGLLTAKNNGTVTVTATAQDGSGLKGTLTIVVENQVDPVAAIGDIERFNMYPNPAVNGRFNVEGVELVKQIRITDVHGRSIQVLHLNNESSASIQLDPKPALYFVQFIRGKEFVVQKLVVR